MEWVRKIGLVGMSAFMLYPLHQLYQVALRFEPGQIPVLGSIVLGFSLSMVLTGIFAFVGFALPTNKFLPDRFYMVKNEEFIDRIYSIMYVEWFKVFLLIFIWGGKNRKKFFDGKRSGLSEMLYETKQAEFGHLGGFLLAFPASIFLAVYGHWMWLLFLQVFNVFGNVYPIILQRKHRIRLERLLNSANSK